MNWQLCWGLIYCVESVDINVVLSAVAVSLMKLLELSKSDVSVKKSEQEHKKFPTISYLVPRIG